MAAVQVKKVVAVLFLEAAKLTLDHIAAYRLELSNTGVPGSPDLPRFYGEIRRVRDYLQRCVTGYQENVGLELAPADQGLLVACCRRMVEALDQRIVSDQIMSAEERALVQRKRQVLADWVVELAEKPLLDLPIPALGSTQTEALRALRTRLQNKLFKQRMIQGIGTQPPAGPSFSAGVSVVPVESPSPSEEIEEKVTPPQPAAGRPLLHAHLLDEAHADALIEPSRLRDPRLRALLQLDLRSYARAVEAKDHRIATVLLAGILEAAIIDHALHRRAELGITGGPETWKLPELLVKFMGASFTPQDKASSFHLFAARNLLRPTIQITTPTVVTAASLQKLQEFVGRALRAMGFCSSVASQDDAQPSIKALLEPDEFD